MCQELLIPEQANNKQMQRLAAEAYQNIQRYADHALAVIRVLTLAKWNPKQELGAPLQQLLHQVANGWTLGAGQGDSASADMTQMGLAISSHTWRAQRTRTKSTPSSAPTTQTTSTNYEACNTSMTHHSS